MKLDKKKQLAARTLGISKERIIFNINRLEEIKEAITKQDIKDLLNNKAISIKEIKGRKTKVKKKRRRQGSIKKKPNKSKREYVLSVRKLRRNILSLKNQGKISSAFYKELRKDIKTRKIKDIAQLKEKVGAIKK